MEGGVRTVDETDRPGEAATRRLRVELRIDADETFQCPLVSTEDIGHVESVRINAVGEECTVDFQCEGDTVVSSAGSVEADCLCRRFQAHDCVPHVREVDGETMLVRTYVGERATIRKLVSELRSAVGEVRLERLAVVDDHDRSEEALVDLAALTAKQREALELAVFRGYFDGEVDLADLAADLDISKSAASQRLRAAEAKLVRMALESQ